MEPSQSLIKTPLGRFSLAVHRKQNREKGRDPELPPQPTKKQQQTNKQRTNTQTNHVAQENHSGMELIFILFLFKYGLLLFHLLL